MSASPRYLLIKQHLLRQIYSGAYQPHHRILPEEQLAAKFGVSRMTANKAIRDLVQEGYLERKSGVGTFVTDLKVESALIEVFNIADEVTQRGHAYANEVVCRETVAADEAMAMRLATSPGMRVFHTILVHTENGVPIQVEDRYVNSDWVPHYLETDFALQTPNQVLVAACPISWLEHTVEAILPDAVTAGLLEIAASTPCLCMTRRTWSGEHLISYACLTYPGDRYKLRSSAPSSLAARRPN